MPVITLEVSQLTKDQKREIIRQFTDTASEITKIPKEAFVILIKENPLGNIGNGGKTLEDIMADRSGS